MTFPWAEVIGGVISAGGAIGSASMYQPAAGTPVQFQLGTMAANRRSQEVFMKNQLRWRMLDAKRAGIHPLAAIGAGTGSGFQPTSFIPDSPGARDKGAWLREIGQEISRAISSMETPQEKRMQQLELELKQAEIDRLTAGTQQIMKDLYDKLDAPGLPDPNDGWNWFGIPGQDHPATRIVANEIPAAEKPGLEAGNPALTKNYSMASGAALPTLTQQASEPLESDLFAKGRYFFHEAMRYVKAWKPGYEQIRELMKYRPARAPKNHEWRYDRLKGMFYLYEKGDPGDTAFYLNPEIKDKNGVRYANKPKYSLKHITKKQPKLKWGIRYVGPYWRKERPQSKPYTKEKRPSKPNPWKFYERW